MFIFLLSEGPIFVKKLLKLFAISSVSVIGVPFSMKRFGNLCFLFVLLKIPFIIFQVTTNSDHRTPFVLSHICYVPHVPGILTKTIWPQPAIYGPLPFTVRNTSQNIVLPFVMSKKELHCQSPLYDQTDPYQIPRGSL